MSRPPTPPPPPSAARKALPPTSPTPPPPPSAEGTALPPAPPPSPPPSTYKFKIENREVKTTVIANESDLSSCLSDFLSFISADRQIKRIVGLDIELSYASFSDTSSAATSKVAILKLGAGRRCLLIQLLHFKSIPPSLASFLDLPDLSFIGVGIHRCLAALERDYGLGCRNSVDLAKLAATVKDKPYLTAFGLVDLANEVGMLNVGMKVASVALSDWGASSLSSDQVKAATVDTYLCFHIGNLLLGGISL